MTAVLVSTLLVMWLLIIAMLVVLWMWWRDEHHAPPHRDERWKDAIEDARCPRCHHSHAGPEDCDRWLT